MFLSTFILFLSTFILYLSIIIFYLFIFILNLAIYLYRYRRILIYSLSINEESDYKIKKILNLNKKTLQHKEIRPILKFRLTKY